MSNDKRYWFSAKPYGNGWGWGPPFSWQGWIVFLAYFALIFAGILLIPQRSWLANFVYIAVITAGLIGITIWKGEPQQTRPPAE